VANGRSAKRYLSVVEFLIKSPNSVTNKEISKGTDIPERTLYTILKNLRDVDWVDADILTQERRKKDGHSLAGSFSGPRIRFRLHPRIYGIIFDYNRTVFEKMLEIRTEEEERRGAYAHTKRSERR
jgi:hypothetical protein